MEMSYPSVDALQKTLVDEVFHYAQDKKKAAGRALGTLIEIITYYMIDSWGLRNRAAVERPLPEFANPEITHNVEFSLHPLLEEHGHVLPFAQAPITAAKLRRSFGTAPGWHWKSSTLLTNSGIVRNACVLADHGRRLLVANLDGIEGDACRITLSVLHPNPYAIFECKRVGVEEGMKKGPQTIEKAKQGAYVARSVSSLQKVRMSDGGLGGVIAVPGGRWECKPHGELLAEVIASESPELLAGFVLTVGVVSNHGNWFTSDNQNKELKVLAQSYDWLLFLTDAGLAEFINDLLLSPSSGRIAAREAFLTSYQGLKQGNRFTKVQMDLRADGVLRRYFRENAHRIAGWFNIIAPGKGSLETLRAELQTLGKKNWKTIYSDD
jgi:hypothetical protein